MNQIEEERKMDDKIQGIHNEYGVCVMIWNIRGRHGQVSRNVRIRIPEYESGSGFPIYIPIQGASVSVWTSVI